ncbi:MAG: hypothetical protein ACRDK3_07680, partial [Actinomycetota bacterium]
MIGGSQQFGQFDEEIGAEVEHLARRKVDRLSRERLGGSMISSFRQSLCLCHARQSLSLDTLGRRRPRAERSEVGRRSRSFFGAQDERQSRSIPRNLVSLSDFER